MTESLEKAIEVMRTLPPQQQDELARVVMMYTGADADDPVVELSEDEEAALKVGLEAADRRDFATDDQMRAIWTKFGR